VTHQVYTSYLITGVITQLTVMRVLPVLDGGSRHDVEKVVERKGRVPFSISTYSTASMGSRYFT
jgi:hypothetical protein